VREFGVAPQAFPDTRQEPFHRSSVRMRDACEHKEPASSAEFVGDGEPLGLWDPSF